MEERKLNFNAPLLSARRFSTITSSIRAKGKKPENSLNSQLDRRHTLPLFKSDLNDQVTEPVAVPFKWEQIPGIRKNGSMREHRVPGEASITPRTPPGRVLDIAKFKDENVFRSLIELDHLKDVVNDKAGFDSVNDDDDDYDDDAYLDALDTLSPTDSFSVNCSVSGISDCDDLAVKQPGTFSTDPQTRDFMMSRFLPAAKAMALEPSQYSSSRRQIVPVEQPRQITKVVTQDKTTPPVKQNESLPVPHYEKSVEEEESEDEYEYEEYDDSAKFSTKACGFLPRLSFKNSLCLLNPVPAMKIRTHSSISSTRSVEKLTKHLKDFVNKQNQDSKVQSPRLQEVKNKVACGSNHFSYATDRQMISRTSPFRRSSGGLSSHRNEVSQSPIRRAKFPGVSKEAESYNANRNNFHNAQGSKSGELCFHHGTKHLPYVTSPAVEKTLYVDTVKMVKASPPNLGSRVKDLTTLLESNEVEAPVAAESCFQHQLGLAIKKGEDSVHQVTSPLRGQTGVAEDFCDLSKALVCVSASTNHQSVKEDDQGSVKPGLVQSPVPLLLPKTPSESWLWRTLPAASSQNTLSRLNHGASSQSKLQDSKASSTNTKWETIVKSSYLHHDHVRYSEELIPHVSQQSKR